MAYSTNDQLFNNVKAIEKTYSTGTPTPATFAAERIVEADKVVRVDLSRAVTVSSIPDVTDDPATPECINLLSQYKAAELSLARMSGTKRKADEYTDLTYWRMLYKELLESILDGKTSTDLSDGTSISTGINTFTPASTDVKPFFGYNKEGQFADDDDLEDIRDNEGSGF